MSVGLLVSLKTHRAIVLAFSGTDANQNITVPETQTLREEEQKEQVEAEIAACGWTRLF